MYFCECNNFHEKYFVPNSNQDLGLMEKDKVYGIQGTEMKNRSVQYKSVQNTGNTER